MTTISADRIAELEDKIDRMSAQMDLLADELREQRLRREQWDELRSDLAPIAGEAMTLASNELEAVQEWVRPEDLLRLLRREFRRALREQQCSLIVNRSRLVPQAVDVDHVVVAIDVLAGTVVPVVRRAPTECEPRGEPRRRAPRPPVEGPTIV